MTEHMRGSNIAQPPPSQSALLAMVQICDSAFPSGAFALSNGVETLVELEQLTDTVGFERYVRDWCALLPYRELGQMTNAQHIGRQMLLRPEDANTEVSVADCLRDARSCTHPSDPWRQLARLDALSAAATVASEVRNGSRRMCSSVRKIIASYEHFPLLDGYGTLIDDGTCSGTHSIMVGLFAASIHMDAPTAASLYAHSLLSGLIVCAVKCVPLKQSDGQRILYESNGWLLRAVECAACVEAGQLGVSGPLMELASMQHETMYSRLFMS